MGPSDKGSQGASEILVVDDAPANLALLSSLLSEQGYRVRPATSGALALRSVAVKAPDLILLDVKMPDMDGFEVCRRLKANEHSRGIPVLFVSVLSDVPDKLEGFIAGGLDFISKPFDTEELLARVRTHLRLRSLSEQMEQHVRERTVALEDSERRFRALFEQAAVGVARIETATGRFLQLNQKYADIVGYTRAQMEQLDCRAITHPDDLADDLANLALLAAGTIHEFTREKRYFHKDGAVVWVNLTVSPMWSPGEPPTCHIAVAEDITRRKQAEADNARLEEQLELARKMEAIGRLAGGVAHDFNNMLNVILGHVELAMEQLAPAHPIKANLLEVSRAAERSASLTAQLLAFARKQAISPRTLDLNQTIPTLLEMLRRLIGEDIELRYTPSEALWPVRMDPSQVDQVLANLCVNSRDAIAGNGAIAIETDNAVLDEASCAAYPDVEPGSYVRLRVSDTGCGMDKETLAKVFDPFFTTKALGRGTGLGLATIYGIVKQNHGHIEVHSEPGQGTTFAIYLRRTGSDVASAEATSPGAEAVCGRETILLVEDERAILELTAEVLTRQGYTVLCASSPLKGLALAAEHEAEIHMLITDVIMPEMSGRTLADKLTLTRPNLKRLFISGYPANAIAHHGVLDDGLSFLQKPFRRRELLSKIREVLDRNCA